jgi:hypothetical protein
VVLVVAVMEKFGHLELQSAGPQILAEAVVVVGNLQLQDLVVQVSLSFAGHKLGTFK